MSKQKKSTLVIQQDFILQDISRVQVECNLTDGAGGAAPPWRTLTFVTLAGF